LEEDPVVQAVIDAAVGDPLVAFLALLAAGVAVSHLLFRRHPLGRAVVRIVLLILLTVVLLRADIVPYQPLQHTGAPIRDVVHAVLKIAWWLWAAWFLVGILHAFLIVERRPHEGRLAQDLLAGVVYLAALFAIVGYVFDLSIQGMLATSGVIAIILGLALQSTLGDVFSGIVLSFSRPYRLGDWIDIDAGTEGRVIEMNWRATHILTGRRDLAIVPNSSIAKAKIVNVSSPSGVHGITVTVGTDSNTPPSLSVEVLQRAVLNCRTIMPIPAPAIAIKAIGRGRTEYEVTFFVEELAASTQAQNELLDVIYRHLAAEGIGLASPSNELWRPAETRVAASLTRSERVLDLVEFLRPLPPAERSAIAAKLRPRLHEQGDTLLEPGTALQSLFIVGSGVLSVADDGGEAGTEIGRLGPGDHFGEIGMLTGAASVVKITALTSASVYELTKEELAPILETRPEASRQLSRALAQRQAIVRESKDVEPEHSARRGQIRNWLAGHFRRRYGIAAS
jgi:small-conductance mechanosensitive channel/CRP-like cAMP-binding protein